MGGALAHLSPELDDVDSAIEQLLLRDLAVRDACDDQRRAGLQVQARADPRGCLLGFVEVRRAPISTPAFAEWLAANAGDELLEIRAFHLDQAARLLAELDGAAPEELREEAAEALTNAGRRALSRESFRSARKLLLRAVELAPTLERRYLAGRAAWRLADFPAVLVEMGEVASDAEQAGETRVQGPGADRARGGRAAAPRRRSNGAAARRAGGRCARWRSSRGALRDPLDVLVRWPPGSATTRSSSAGRRPRSRPRVKPIGRISRRSSSTASSPRT